MDTYLLGTAAEARNDFAFHLVRVRLFGAGFRADDFRAGGHDDECVVVVELSLRLSELESEIMRGGFFFSQDEQQKPEMYV